MKEKEEKNIYIYTFTHTHTNISKNIKMVRVTVEFLGGLDVIVKKQRQYKVDVKVDGKDEVDVGDLIQWIVDNLIEHERDVNVFLENDSIRPGILTLINDTDWELEGEKEYVLEDGDVVSFTSTLHGG